MSVLAAPVHVEHVLDHPIPSTRGGPYHEQINNSYPRALDKGKLVVQKIPLRLKDIWAIRIRLQLAEKFRDLALFELVIDSKLRACCLVKLRLRDVSMATKCLQEPSSHSRKRRASTV